MFFSRRILVKKCARLLQWVVFFDTKVPLFCSFVQQPQTSTTSNLNNSKLRSASKTKRKNKTDVHNLEITLRIPPLFFGTMRLFENFWIEYFSPKGPPSIFLMFCNTMDVKKLQRVPPFTFFGTVTLFKNLIKNFFLGNFFMSPKGPPFNFLKFFATSWSFTKPEGFPF